MSRIDGSEGVIVTVHVDRDALPERTLRTAQANGWDAKSKFGMVGADEDRRRDEKGRTGVAGNSSRRKAVRRARRAAPTLPAAAASPTCPRSCAKRARAALVAYRAARAAWPPARRAPWGPKDPFSVAVAAREKEWHRWQAILSTRSTCRSHSPSPKNSKKLILDGAGDSALRIRTSREERAEGTDDELRK